MGSAEKRNIMSSAMANLRRPTTTKGPHRLQVNAKVLLRSLKERTSSFTDFVNRPLQP